MGDQKDDEMEDQKGDEGIEETEEMNDQEEKNMDEEPKRKDEEPEERTAAETVQLAEANYADEEAGQPAEEGHLDAA